MAPDGDVSYLGRGQSQVWVPALTAAALLKGARSLATTDPTRAARYLAGAQQALQRLATLHQAPYGFLVVPGARTTVNGLDFYVNTLAYNGLTLFGLQIAADAATGLPPLPAVPPPSHTPLRVHDPEGSGLGILATGRHWMAVNSRGRERRDLRYDFGLAGLQLRQADGTWRSLLAPRPLTGFPVGLSAGPTLRRGGRVGLPQSETHARVAGRDPDRRRLQAQQHVPLAAAPRFDEVRPDPRRRPADRRRPAPQGELHVPRVHDARHRPARRPADAADRLRRLALRPHGAASGASTRRSTRARSRTSRGSRSASRHGIASASRSRSRSSERAQVRRYSAAAPARSFAARDFLRAPLLRCRAPRLTALSTSLTSC